MAVISDRKSRDVRTRHNANRAICVVVANRAICVVVFFGNVAEGN